MSQILDHSSALRNVRAPRQERSPDVRRRGRIVRRRVGAGDLRSQSNASFDISARRMIEIRLMNKSNHDSPLEKSPRLL
ncbi:hypothetical protein [Burkholderia mayonis]|uniref:hypothetical protein n=1 Tax=Burkholderia mayonis TaxID=1385591 RepID=UPI0013968033|nr:hypothetical protein [Burkholderia mayonis]